MSKDTLEKVYIDANILINYSLGPDKVTKKEQFEVAEKVFNDAINGNYKIAISFFLLSETLNALRRISMRNAFEIQGRGCSQNQIIRLANSPAFKETIKRESEQAFLEITDKITKDTAHFLLENTETVYLGTLFQQGFQIMLSTFGDFWVYRNRCPVCKNYLNYCHCCGVDSEMSYKAVNTPDLAHLFIAKALGCKRFLTMDKWYGKITEKSPLKIEVLRA